jgi:hypothetical protein
MPDNHLGTLFKSVQIHYFNRKYKKIDVEYHRFRSFKHTIEWTPWRIRIKVNEHFRGAPEKILEMLAIILLARVYRVKVGRDIRDPYNDYIDTIRDSLPAKRYNRLDSYTAQGDRYDLDRFFQQLNTSYFNNMLKAPTLGWSRNKSYWRLGFYDRERDLLVISQIFDQSRVPEKIVKYLVFHEMLHIFFPVERKNGRRIIHSLKFKETERRFPQYQDIQAWLKRNLRKL